MIKQVGFGGSVFTGIITLPAHPLLRVNSFPDEPPVKTKSTEAPVPVPKTMGWVAVLLFAHLMRHLSWDLLGNLLRNPVTLLVRNVNTNFMGNLARYLIWHFNALLFGNLPTFLLRHLNWNFVTVCVGNIMAIFIWHLHRMLYRDVMAMFLGIHLTVLVVAIPVTLFLMVDFAFLLILGFIFGRVMGFAIWFVFCFALFIVLCRIVGVALWDV